MWVCSKPKASASFSTRAVRASGNLTRRWMSECPVGHHASPDGQADRRQESGAAEDAGGAGLSDGTGLERSHGGCESLLEPLEADTDLMGAEPEIGERREQRHTDLTRPMGDRATAAPGEPQRQLPRAEFVVGHQHVGPGAEPADRDAGLEFEDDERGMSASRHGRLAGEPLGHAGVARPIDAAGEPGRERPGGRERHIVGAGQGSDSR
jgi:hypothetical protein